MERRTMLNVEKIEGKIIEGKRGNWRGKKEKREERKEEKRRRQWMMRERKGEKRVRGEVRSEEKMVKRMIGYRRQKVIEGNVEERGERIISRRGWVKENRMKREEGR